MFPRQMLHFDFNQNTPETYANQIFFEKGVLIKHSKAALIVKVEFSDL